MAQQSHLRYVVQDAFHPVPTFSPWWAKVGFGARPWKNASAEDGGSTSTVQVMAGAALIQDLRPGLLAVAVPHRGS